MTPADRAKIVESLESIDRRMSAVQLELEDYKDLDRSVREIAKDLQTITKAILMFLPDANEEDRYWTTPRRECEEVIPCD